MKFLGLTVFIIGVFSECDSSTWVNKPVDYGFTADCGSTIIADGSECTITSREVGYFNGSVACSGTSWKIVHANKSYIPNPSFEVALSCPTGYSAKGDWEKTLKDWYQATNPTTDHWTFDPNCPNANVGGSRVSPTKAADGVGYIGMIIQSAWMEYAGACLTTPISKGEEYTLGMSVAADSKSGAIVGDVVVMCAPKCTDGKVYYDTSTTLENDLVNLAREPVNIPDNNWKAIEMKFVATADCEGIVIGGSTNILKQSNSNHYMFIDGLNFATRKEIEQAQGKSPTCGNPTEQQMFRPGMTADSKCETCDIKDCFEDKTCGELGEGQIFQPNMKVDSKCTNCDTTDCFEEKTCGELGEGQIFQPNMKVDSKCTKCDTTDCFEDKTCGKPSETQIFQPNMKVDSKCTKCDTTDCFEVAKTCGHPSEKEMFQLNMKADSNCVKCDTECFETLSCINVAGCYESYDKDGVQFGTVTMEQTDCSGELVQIVKQDKQVSTFQVIRDKIIWTGRWKYVSTKIETDNIVWNNDAVYKRVSCSKPCPVVEPVCPVKTCPTIETCPIGSTFGTPAIHCEANETCCGKCACCVSDDNPLICVKPVKNCWDDVVDGHNKKCDGGVPTGTVTDVQACKTICLESTNCVGIYFNSTSGECFTSTTCTSISQSIGFTVHQLDRDCLDCETAKADNANKTERIEELELEISTLRKLSKHRRF